MVLNNDGQKIYRWYKEVLSGFAKPEEQVALHEHDIITGKKPDPITSELPTLLVPILKAENFGEHMSIDDKNIGGEGYTIIANKTTGKIALCAQTTKVGMLTDLLQKIPVTLLYGVKTISKDLAEGYDWLSRTVFMNAMRIDDKFHVLKLGFEALQEVRIRHRQVILTEERDRREAKKARERELRDEAAAREEKREKGEPAITEKIPKPKVHSNGDTTKELLARSRYLLFSFREKWTESQKERAQILFQEFPDIEQAYNLMIRFRGFYQTSIGDITTAKKRLKEWYALVGLSDIEELNLFASTVEDHQTTILHYFDAGSTNAYAESLNAQIQRFVQTNQGTRDRDFFHFRLKGYFG
jgi:transposase